MNVRVSPLGDGPKEVKEIPNNKEQRAESAFCKDIMESLILAQDERWRRA